ncbi:MAG: hypothetical protein GC154_11170 [bacterium]|nr:hypothetical protein [bacterium]
MGFPLFSFHYFTMKIIPYLGIHIAMGMNVFFILGVIQVVRKMITPESRSEGLLLFGSIVPVSLLYTSYYFFDGPMRFFMPLFYLYAIAGVWLIKDLSEWHQQGVYRAGAVMVAAYMVWGVSFSASRMYQESIASRYVYQIEDAVLKNVNKQSVIIAPMQLLLQLDLVGKWKLADAIYIDEKLLPARPRPGLAPDAGADRGPAMERMQVHDSKVKQQYQLSKDGAMSEVLLHDLVTWADGHKIYYLGVKDDMSDIVDHTHRVEMNILKEYEIKPDPRNRLQPRDRGNFIRPPINEESQPDRGRRVAPGPGSPPPNGGPGRGMKPPNIMMFQGRTIILSELTIDQ